MQCEQGCHPCRLCANQPQIAATQRQCQRGCAAIRHSPADRQGKGGMQQIPPLPGTLTPTAPGSASPIGDHEVICAQSALGASHLQVLCERLRPQSWPVSLARLGSARTAVEWSTAGPGSSALCSHCLLASFGAVALNEPCWSCRMPISVITLAQRGSPGEQCCPGSLRMRSKCTCVSLGVAHALHYIDSQQVSPGQTRTGSWLCARQTTQWWPRSAAAHPRGCTEALQQFGIAAHSQRGVRQVSVFPWQPGRSGDRDCSSTKESS